MTTIWQPGTLYAPGNVVVPTAAAAVASTPPDNAGFEDGDSDWTKGTGWAINDDAAFVGDYSAVNSGTGVDLVIVNDLKAEVTPGQSVSARCLVRGDASDADATVAVALRWYTSGDVHISDSPGNDVGGSSSWKDSRVTATAPATAAKVSICAIAQNENGVALRVDAFTWNHVVPTAAQLLAFRAIQDAAGLSGSTEPTWPTSVSGTVVDGEVTWEAFEARTVTWRATPNLVSGDTEPLWPIEGDSFVSDGTIAWKAIPYRIDDPNCPQSKIVAIGASKIFAGDGDVIRFSSTLDPRDWSSAKDAGFLPSGLSQKGQVAVEAMGIYRGNLVAWSASTFQMWQIDPDPTAMGLQDTLEGIGTTYPKAVQPVSNDLFFCSQLGVRSVGLSAGSGNLQAGDVGLPIDTLIQALVAGKQPLATYYPSAGQYWITTANEDPVPADPPLLMPCPLLTDGQVGIAYSYTPTVTNGDGLDLTFEITAGALPPWATLDPFTGEISGTPNAIDDYEFTLTVSADGYQSAQCIFSLRVGPPALWWLVGSHDNATNIYNSTDLSTWNGPFTRSSSFLVSSSGSTGGPNMAMAQNTLSLYGSYTGVGNGSQRFSDYDTSNGVTVTNQAITTTALFSVVVVPKQDPEERLIFLCKSGSGLTTYGLSVDGGANFVYPTVPANSDGVRRARHAFRFGGRWFLQLYNSSLNSPWHDMAYVDAEEPSTGSTWTTFRSTTDLTSEDRGPVAANEDAAVYLCRHSVGTNSGMVFRSTNGTTWSAVSTPISGVGTAGLSGASIAGETGFIIYTDGANMIGSDDNGATWESCTALPDSQTPTWAIAVGDRIIVRTDSADQRAFYTDDYGQTWTEITLPTPTSGGDVKVSFGWSGGGFLALGGVNMP